MSQSTQDTIRHAETMMDTLRDEAEPDLNALKVTDSFGTKIWLTPYDGESRYQVYIRNRQRYDSDTRRDETPTSVRQLLAGAIADELNGKGTSVNYTNREETPI